MLTQLDRTGPVTSAVLVQDGCPGNQDRGDDSGGGERGGGMLIGHGWAFSRWGTEVGEGRGPVAVVPAPAPGAYVSLAAFRTGGG
ncbi:hypothetical protein ACIRP3_02140 [Streptomyces sp. NPDC101209]|uniref:hypothetical protein n=1 Tax=Streptomyces sp. NPDC101209 TaxID=3366129 RepID=UPI0037F1C719